MPNPSISKCQFKCKAQRMFQRAAAAITPRGNGPRPRQVFFGWADAHTPNQRRPAEPDRIEPVLPAAHRILQQQDGVPSNRGPHLMTLESRALPSYADLFALPTFEQHKQLSVHLDEYSDGYVLPNGGYFTLEETELLVDLLPEQRDGPQSQGDRPCPICRRGAIRLRDGQRPRFRYVEPGG
ncbi:hypothetical protein P154DRAFT_540714 [Amniculicola lignicola CBS 123094]|uniref:Uncharacterized protein n=1 Tax=Amniculicola lignicola CBS 123094 TaxID=1392246 RepID=A0A6A5VU73_9PLEO|nr:hypothetical protein P154DRAFT_540714 [Amniculicola lignicola CBS 123094]